MTETNSTQLLDALQPSDVLMELVVASLAPMFLDTSGGDLALARLAAIDTISGYQINSQADLLAVAQVIAFGLAALASLSRSMDDDVPPNLALRLRGIAGSLSRCANQNRRAIAQRAASQQPAFAASDKAGADYAPRPPPHPAETVPPNAGSSPQTQPFTPRPATAPRADPPLPRHRAIWAAAMMDAAGQCTAGLPLLSPAERRKASIRAAALNGSADALLFGATAASPATALG